MTHCALSLYSNITWASEQPNSGSQIWLPAASINIKIALSSRIFCKFWGFHSCITDNANLLEYDTVATDNQILIFRGNIVSSSSRVKMSSQPSGCGYYIALKCQNTVMHNYIPPRTKSSLIFCYLKQNVAIGNIMSMKGTMGNRPWEPLYWRISRVDFHANERNNSYTFSLKLKKISSMWISPSIMIHFLNCNWVATQWQ